MSQREFSQRLQQELSERLTRQYPGNDQDSHRHKSHFVRARLLTLNYKEAHWTLSALHHYKSFFFHPCIHGYMILMSCCEQEYCYLQRRQGNIVTEHVSHQRSSRYLPHQASTIVTINFESFSTIGCSQYAVSHHNSGQRKPIESD